MSELPQKFAKLIIFLLTVWTVTCYKKPVSKPVPNIPPETYIFLSDTTDTVGAKQTLFWFGNDPDGIVIGYYLAIDDTSQKIFTTRNDSTFVFPAESTVIYHIFYCWAVDNEGAVDTSPAKLVIPVINTPPTVTFDPHYMPMDTTFPVVTFYFEAHDEDGDETIEGFLARLDRNSLPQVLPPDQRSISLRDIPPGKHAFYLQAFDEAGALSSPLVFTWYVRSAVGDFLLVNDDTSSEASAFYRDFLDYQGVTYTFWSVLRGLPPAPGDVNAIINEMGFKTIMWVNGQNRPHLTQASVALSTFAEDPTNRLIIIGNRVLIDSLKYFWQSTLHVDSVITDGFILQNMVIRSNVPDLPDSLIPTAPIISHVPLFIPDSAAEAIYMHPGLGQIPSAPIGSRYPGGETSNVYLFTFPLHLLNGNNNIPHLLAKILGLQ